MSLNDANYSDEDYGEDVAAASNRPSPVEIAGRVSPYSFVGDSYDDARGNIAAGGNSELGCDDVGEDELGNRATGDAYDTGTELGNRATGDAYDTGTELGNRFTGDAYDTGTELGMSPWDVFAAEPVVVGEEAVRRVVERARNSRAPAPPMKAVSADAPVDESLHDDWGLTDVFLGAAEAAGADAFPKTTALMLKHGAGGEPRYVRVDTEASYKKFRAKSSPEMAELRSKVEELTARLAAHEADPEAHRGAGEEAAEDLVAMGEAALSAEQAKRVDLWLPRRFDGKWSAWVEGDYVCASIALPGRDGEIRICTSLEPIRKCVAEMARHAGEAGVPAASVVGVIPAMGAVLGAGTAVKEMAAGAGAILRRPEAAGRGTFYVRLEPKVNPALFALAALARECASGDRQACDEWRRLGEAGPAPVRQAMTEAVALASGRRKAA